MRWTCTACRVPFDGDEERCPKCLRKSTVQSADAPASDAGADVVAGARLGRKIVVGLVASMLVAVALGGVWLSVLQLELVLFGRTVTGAVVAAEMPMVSLGFQRCDVDYAYRVGGIEYRGSADVAFACPQTTSIDVRVSSLDPSNSDLGSGLGVLRFLGTAIACAGAYAASVVALQLFFPRSPRLRRLAARVGSRYVREA